MTLADPTGGLGYSFGQKLPHTHMTTISAQQPNAIDGVNGGTYTCANMLTTTFNKGITCTFTTTTPGTGTGFFLNAYNNIEIDDLTPLGNLVTTIGGKVNTTLEHVTGNYQALTADSNHTITGFIVRSTFSPTNHRTLTIPASLPTGSIVMLRIDNVSVSKNIIIKDSTAVTVATLGSGAGTRNWIQIGVTDLGTGFTLAWDGGAAWTIAV